MQTAPGVGPQGSGPRPDLAHLQARHLVDTGPRAPVPAQPVAEHDGAPRQPSRHREGHVEAEHEQRALGCLVPTPQSLPPYGTGVRDHAPQRGGEDPCLVADPDEQGAQAGPDEEPPAGPPVLPAQHGEECPDHAGVHQRLAHRRGLKVEHVRVQPEDCGSGPAAGARSGQVTQDQEEPEAGRDVATHGEQRAGEAGQVQGVVPRQGGDQHVLQGQPDTAQLGQAGALPHDDPTPDHQVRERVLVPQHEILLEHVPPTQHREQAGQQQDPRGVTTPRCTAQPGTRRPHTRHSRPPAPRPPHGPLPVHAGPLSQRPRPFTLLS